MNFFNQLVTRELGSANISKFSSLLYVAKLTAPLSGFWLLTPALIHKTYSANPKYSTEHDIIYLLIVIIVTGFRGVNLVKLATGIERDNCTCKRR